jgi:hypothetical protein
MSRSVHRLVRVDGAARRTIVVQTGERSSLMRCEARFGRTFPQSFPQFL